MRGGAELGSFPYIPCPPSVLRGQYLYFKTKSPSSSDCTAVRMEPWPVSGSPCHPLNPLVPGQGCHGTSADDRRNGRCGKWGSTGVGTVLGASHLAQDTPNA